MYRHVVSSLFVVVVLLLAVLSVLSTPAGTSWAESAEEKLVYIGPELIAEAELEEKVAVLTFDNGPSRSYTPSILDILDEYDVKATFFVLGQNVFTNINVINRIFEEGHELANRTHTHADITELTWEKIIDEIQNTEDRINTLTEARTTLFRPPYGRITSEQIELFYQETDYHIVAETINTHDEDSERNQVETIVERVETQLHAGAVILMHDGGGPRSNTVKALPEIINLIQERGYEIIKAGELIELLEESIK